METRKVMGGLNNNFLKRSLNSDNIFISGLYLRYRVMEKYKRSSKTWKVGHPLVPVTALIQADSVKDALLIFIKRTGISDRLRESESILKRLEFEFYGSLLKHPTGKNCDIYATKYLFTLPSKTRH